MAYVEADVYQLRTEMGELMRLVFIHGDKERIRDPASTAVRVSQALRRLATASPSDDDLKVVEEVLREVKALQRGRRFQSTAANQIHLCCNRALEALCPGASSEPRPSG